MTAVMASSEEKEPSEVALSFHRMLFLTPAVDD